MHEVPQTKTTILYIHSDLFIAQVCSATSGKFAVSEVVYQLGLKNRFAMCHYATSDFFYICHIFSEAKDSDLNQKFVASDLVSIPLWL